MNREKLLKTGSVIADIILWLIPLFFGYTIFTLAFFGSKEFTCFERVAIGLMAYTIYIPILPIAIVYDVIFYCVKKKCNSLSNHEHIAILAAIIEFIIGFVSFVVALPSF